MTCICLFSTDERKEGEASSIVAMIYSARKEVDLKSDMVSKVNDALILAESMIDFSEQYAKDEYDHGFLKRVVVDAKKEKDQSM